jgi:hypothetical protein
MMKIEGSGSISQRHGSADPGPHQNVMDPQYCFLRIFGFIFQQWSMVWHRFLGESLLKKDINVILNKRYRKDQFVTCYLLNYLVLKWRCTLIFMLRTVPGFVMSGWCRVAFLSNICGSVNNGVAGSKCYNYKIILKQYQRKHFEKNKFFQLFSNSFSQEKNTYLL